MHAYTTAVYIKALLFHFTGCSHTASISHKLHAYYLGKVLCGQYKVLATHSDRCPIRCCHLYLPRWTVEYASPDGTLSNKDMFDLSSVMNSILQQ